MPAFEPSASRPGRAEARLLHQMLGPGTPRVTSLRLAARDYRRRQRRAMAMRALIVVTLAGSFFASVLLASRNGTPSGAVATRTAPFDPDAVTTGSVTTPGKPPQPAAR